MSNQSVAALLCGISLMALATSAFAQQATPTAPQAVQEVVVTGSRIVRNGYSAPTPVTVATAEDLQVTTPSNIPEGLNKLPVFAGSANFSGATNIVGGTGGGAAILHAGNYLNLRNMGQIRTLVLMDGHRVPGTAENSSVDANTLPQALVQRVDVVTGGASAVYGSDAVVGVVNFILDKNFNGLKASAQIGDSTYGDARSYRYSVAAGAHFLGDRAHLEGSFEAYKTNGVDNREHRPWAALDQVYVGSGTVANPYILVANPRLNNSSLGGLILKGAAPPSLVGQQFLANGTLGAFNAGTPTGTSTINIGGDGGRQLNAPVNFPDQTYQAFTRLDYELTPDIKAYAQVSFAENRDFQQQTGGGANLTVSIFSGNPYLPAAAQAAMIGTGTAANPQFPSFALAKIANDLNPDSTHLELIDDINVTTGLTGKLGAFNWDAYYTHGAAIVHIDNSGNTFSPNLYAALDAVTVNGQAVCRVSTTAFASLYPGCAPLNLFGQGNENAAALAFVNSSSTGTKIVSLMDDYAASISGDAFSDWAGPVSVAANVEYRKQSYSQSSPNPTPYPQINYSAAGSAVSYVGLTPEGPGGTIPTNSITAPSQGANSVWEVSGETVVPLLKDMALARSFDVSAAVRYTNYSTSGSVVTWKFGVNYQPIEDLRIRAAYSRDIRAPTLLDLYQAQSIGQIGFNDPHTGISKQVPAITGGNPNLVPELSYTTTAGFVYSPSWQPRFRMSLDYYSMNLTNVIQAINGSNGVIQAQCEASGGTSPVCAAIVRPLPFGNTTAANFPTYITNFSINAASADTWGIDIEASYNFMLDELVKGAPGGVALRLLEAYQPVLHLYNYPGAPVTELMGVAGASAGRFTANVDYRIGPWSVAYQMRYLSSQNLSQTAVTVYSQPPLPGIFYHDINITYRFKAAGHDSQAYFVVDNLLNQFPRVSPLTNFTSNPGSNAGMAVNGDDMIGRYFTLGFRFQY